MLLRCVVRGTTAYSYLTLVLHELLTYSVMNEISVKLWLFMWLWPAIVTLKHGEEAESAVSQLYGVPLLGTDVQISLYRADNLLCITALPPTLCTDDATFETFVETFGPVEKCFLMRYSNGSLFTDCDCVCNTMYVIMFNLFHRSLLFQLWREFIAVSVYVLL